jgi:hypothetical protein
MPPLHSPNLPRSAGFDEPGIPGSTRFQTGDGRLHFPEMHLGIAGSGPICFHKHFQFSG